MEEKTKLTAYKLYEIGEGLSNALGKCNATKGNKLVIEASESDFSLIDEDLYYRINKEANSSDFVPSDSIIEVKFENLIIEIRKEQPNE